MGFSSNIFYISERLESIITPSSFTAAFLIAESAVSWVTLVVVLLVHKFISLWLV